MRKIIAFLLVFTLLFCHALFPVSAAENDLENASARLMPFDFIFVDTVTVVPDNSFPPGWADFNVVISGVLDIQASRVISLDVMKCTYVGGVNCTVHEMTVQAFVDPVNPSVVIWNLTGTLAITWVSPTTGVQYEKVITNSLLYSFDAEDYAIV